MMQGQHWRKSGSTTRLVEYSSRLAEDQSKLSTQFGAVADVIREAALACPVKFVPVDTAIVGLVDELKVMGREVWSKGKSG